ncbi:MAG: hypothetical protein IK108_10135 [Clostridia bacterium]|nr:hypothetical protein [Clostridia bacterium]
MDFLNRETENLLKECIDNSATFPKILADKFEGLSSDEDSRLRGRIKVLVDNGYFSKLQWADNVPWFGSITEKGYDYFHNKDTYIRAKLRRTPGFKLLDEESEECLRKLCNSSEDSITVNGKAKDAKVLEHLAQLGYIHLGSKGISYTLSGDFAGVVSVTQAGKTYFSEKDKLIEELMLMDSSNDAPDLETSRTSTRKADLQRITQDTSDKNMISFSGILGFDCGQVEPYSGADRQMQEKGFVVHNGIPTLRGFAKMSDLAKASKAKYEEYQRQKNQDHVDEIAAFLEKCKAEAKFLPEVVLSVNAPDKATLRRYNHRAFSGASATLQGAINNMDYYTLDVAEGALSRVDGNHRLEAGKDQDYYVPFSIIVWGIDPENDDNMLSVGSGHDNTESEAFLFYILNNTAKRLEAEENFRGLVRSDSWTSDELAIINRQLPILKHFDKTYAGNPLIDKEFLPAPLSQICEILVEINDLDLGTDEFDTLFIDATKLLGQSESFAYCREQFPNILFQLAFYTRYKSDKYQDAVLKLKLVDKWLEKYKYTGETFSRASKIFDVAYKFISASPKTIFMAMEYKSEQIVADYNGALSRAVHTLNNMGGNILVEAYPIMTGKGKSFSITADIYNKIEECAIFIADTTEANPNVMYELGIAYNKKKPIIMVREKGKHIKVPSDIISDYYYAFSGMTELENLFVTHIKEILVSDYGAVFSD